MISMVVRAFHGPHGIALKAGDGPIDTSGWRTEKQLHSTRYLRPASKAEEEVIPVLAVPASVGRESEGAPKRRVRRK